MFNPNKLVSPTQAVIDNLAGNLHKLFIRNDNTKVQSIEPSTYWRNTCAVVDNFDKDGNITRTAREVLYTRHDLDKIIRDNAYISVQEDGDLTYTLVTNTVSKPVDNAGVGEVAKCLNLVYDYDIYPSDLELVPSPLKSARNTAFGSVLHTVNCKIVNNEISYVNGRLPVVSMPGKYREDGKLTVPAMVAVFNYNVDDTLEFTMPSIHSEEQWVLMVEAVDTSNHTNVGRPLFWANVEETYAGKKVVVYSAFNEWGSASNIDDGDVVRVQTIEGTTHISHRDSDRTWTQNLVNFTKKNNLLRVTAFSKNMSANDFTVKINKTTGTGENIYKTTSFTGNLERFNYASTSQSQSPLDEPSYNYVDSVTGENRKFSVEGYKLDFTRNNHLKVIDLNGGGDYGGLARFATSTVIVLAHQSRWHEDVTNVLRDGLLYSVSDVRANRYPVYSFGTGADYNFYLNGEYANPAADFRTSDVSNITEIGIRVNESTNKVLFTCNDIRGMQGPIPAEGVLVEDASTLDGYVALLVKTYNRDLGYTVLELETSSGGIRYDVNDLVNNTIDYTLKAAANSPSLIGETKYPIRLTNVRCINYQDLNAGKYPPSNDEHSVTTGSVLTYTELKPYVELDIEYRVEGLGRLLELHKIRSLEFKVRSVDNLFETATVKIEFDYETGHVINCLTGNVVTLTNDWYYGTDGDLFRINLNPAITTFFYGANNDTVVTYPHNEVSSTVNDQKYSVEISVVLIDDSVNLPVIYVNHDETEIKLNSGSEL